MRSMLVCAMVAAAACGGGGSGTAVGRAPLKADDGARRVEPGAAAPELIEAPPPLPPVPSTPQPVPDEVIGQLEVANPTDLLASLATLAETASPGYGAALLPEAVIAGVAQVGLDITGIDLQQPIRFLVLDPLDRDIALVAVVGVADAVGLEQAVTDFGLRIQIRGSFAAIGTRDNLVVAAGYALTTLLAEPVATAPTAVIEVAKLVQRYGAELDASADEMFRRRGLLDASAHGKTAFLRGMIALLRQIDRIEIATELDAARASMITRVHPVEGSTLADIVASFTPATFDLLEQLPLGPLALGGRVDLRPIAAAMESTLVEMIASSPNRDSPMIDVYDRWFDLATGENGLCFGLPPTGATVSAMWDIREPSQLPDFWEQLAEAMVKDAAGFTAMFETETSSRVHRGVKVTTATSTLGSSAPIALADRLRIIAGAEGVRVSAAVPGQRVALTVGPDSIARVEGIIDSVKRRKATPAETPLTEVLQEARRRAESYLIAVDTTALGFQIYATYLAWNGSATTLPTPPSLEPLVLGLGASAGTFSMRFTAPAKQLMALITFVNLVRA